MKHKGLFLAFLMFLIPGFPKDILCYLLGLGHMGKGLPARVDQREAPRHDAPDHRWYAVPRRAYGAFFTLVGIGMTVILLVMIYRENIEVGFASCGPGTTGRPARNEEQKNGTMSRSAACQRHRRLSINAPITL